MLAGFGAGGAGDGAGGDDEAVGGEGAVTEAEALRRIEGGPVADDVHAVESAGGVVAVVGELGDQVGGALHDARPVDDRLGSFDAQLGAFADQLGDLGRTQHGLGGHAAAQDAEPAETLATFDEGHRLALVAGNAGGVVAGRTGADDG